MGSGTHAEPRPRDRGDQRPRCRQKVSPIDHQAGMQRRRACCRNAICAGGRSRSPGELQAVLCPSAASPVNGKKRQRTASAPATSRSAALRAGRRLRERRTDAGASRATHVTLPTLACSETPPENAPPAGAAAQIWSQPGASVLDRMLSHRAPAQPHRLPVHACAPPARGLPPTAAGSPRRPREPRAPLSPPRRAGGFVTYYVTTRSRDRRRPAGASQARPVVDGNESDLFVT